MRDIGITEIGCTSNTSDTKTCRSMMGKNILHFLHLNNPEKTIDRRLHLENNSLLLSEKSLLLKLNLGVRGAGILLNSHARAQYACTIIRNVTTFLPFFT